MSLGAHPQLRLQSSREITVPSPCFKQNCCFRIIECFQLKVTSWGPENHVSLINSPSSGSIPYSPSSGSIPSCRIWLVATFTVGIAYWWPGLRRCSMIHTSVLCSVLLSRTRDCWGLRLAWRWTLAFCIIAISPLQSLVYVFMLVQVCAGEGACWRPEGNTRHLPQLLPTITFWQSLKLNCNLPIWLDWPANKPQRSHCLQISSTALCLGFMWVLGIPTQVLTFIHPATELSSQTVTYLRFFFSPT